MQETYLQTYEQMKNRVIERRAQLDRLLDYMEKNTNWLKAPASTKFHLCCESGLLMHTMNVCENILKLREALYPSVSEESCVVVAMLHDLGKVGMPGNPQYIPAQPTERQRQYGYGPKYPFEFNNDLVYLSVPVRSLYLSLPFIKLSQEEVQAIVYHDGQYVDDNHSVATKEEPLTLLLQYADSWSGFVTEKESRKK